MPIFGVTIHDSLCARLKSSFTALTNLIDLRFDEAHQKYILMPRQTTQRTPPCKQRSIYAPDELKNLRIEKQVTRTRESSSYEHSPHYKKCQSSIEPNNDNSAEQPESKMFSPFRADSSETISITDIVSSSPGAKRRLKKLAKKSNAVVADLFAVFMLHKSLETDRRGEAHAIQSR